MEMNKCLCILLLLLSGGLFGQQEAFDAANERYRAEDFLGASEGYQALYEEGWESAELYYNMGNAFFKTGELGEAVWAYERTLTLDPDNEDALVNRAMLQERLVDDIEQLPLPLIERSFRRWADRLGTTGFRSLFIVWLWLVAGCWIAWRMRKARSAFFGMGAGLLLMLLTGIGWWVQNGLQAKEQRAVLLVENVYVKTAPSVQAQDAFVLHEGTVVYLDDRIDSWQEIRLTDGQVGWVEAEVLWEI
jgi:tetratricopeptide (TPR) repeat protein